MQIVNFTKTIITIIDKNNFQYKISTITLINFESLHSKYVIMCEQLIGILEALYGS